MLRFVSILLLAASVAAQSSFQVGKPEQRQSFTFTANGKPYAKRVGRTMEPKQIIDTVAIVSGVGSLKLNESFGARNHRTAPTGGSVSATITRPDTSGVSYAYSYVYVKGKSEIVIKSSGGAADTSVVIINAWVK